MADTAIHWGAEALWRQLRLVLPDLAVEVVPRIQSTNTALLERARVSPEPRADEVVDGAVLVRRSVESGAFGRRAIDLQPCLLVAEHQSAGRGRQGRPWQSAPGASLTFSLGLPLAATDWSGLSLAVGVALCEALAPADPSGPQIGLKWPNDLWLMDGPVHSSAGGRKLGGVLIETVASGAAGRQKDGPNGGANPTRLVVVGVGFNVLPFDAAEVRTGFASLHEIDAAATAPAVLAKVMLPLVRALQQFEREGFSAFTERFAALDLLCDRRVDTTSNEVLEGVARGVSARGALLVQTDSGFVEVSSGEVSVRLAGKVRGDGSADGSSGGVGAMIDDALGEASDPA